MDIGYVHDLMLQILAAEKNGEATHEEIDRFLNRASYANFNDLYNNPKRWRVDKNIGQIYYGASQRIDDAMSPFKRLTSFTTGDTPGGVLTLNADYLHLVGLAATLFNNDLSRNVYHPIEVLNEEELLDRLESQVSPVSGSNPIAIMVNPVDGQSRIQMFPETTHSGRLYYFAKPALCVFAYDQVGRVVTQDTEASVNLEWNDIETYNIISLALSYFGLSLSSAEITQFAELKNKEGQ